MPTPVRKSLLFRIITLADYLLFNNGLGAQHNII